MGGQLERGMVHVYTGDGKGKTTAAFGLAMRAAGRGLKVYVVQFMKGQEYGEVALARAHPDLITVYQAGREEHVNLRNPDSVDAELARRGLAVARDAMASGNIGVLILDELNLALGIGLLQVADVLSFLETKPPELEIVLTGRYAPQEILEAADLVTEMKEIKHYYTQGVLSRPGIDV